jgi:serine/threonine protein kinase
VCTETYDQSISYIYDLVVVEDSSVNPSLMERIDGVFGKSVKENDKIIETIQAKRAEGRKGRARPRRLSVPDAASSRMDSVDLQDPESTVLLAGTQGQPVRPVRPGSCALGGTPKPTAHRHTRSFLPEMISDEKQLLKETDVDGSSSVDSSACAGDGAEVGRRKGRGRSETVVTSKAVRSRANSGAKMINEYTILEKLGSGAYGKVKKIQDLRTDEVYALKICNKEFLKRQRKGKEHNALEDVLREMAIWKKLSHPNIVNLLEIIDDPESHELYMISDFMPNGTVAEVGSGGVLTADVFSDDRIRKISRDVALGLRYLHRNGIVHHDIKPENLLFDGDDVVRLTDFGVSRMFTEDEGDVMKHSAGTPAFTAPEAISPPYEGRPVDIYAFGVTLYVLATGHLPFHARTEYLLYHCIRKNPIEFPDTLTPSLRDLLEKMLNKDPLERISLEGILRHPFAADGGWVAPIEDEALVEVSDDEVRTAVSKEGLILRKKLNTILPALMGVVDKVRKRRSSVRRPDEEVRLNVCLLNDPKRHNYYWREYFKDLQNHLGLRCVNVEKGLKDFEVFQDDDMAEAIMCMIHRTSPYIDPVGDPPKCLEEPRGDEDFGIPIPT